MCDIQQCHSLACEGAWDCTAEAVIIISFSVGGGFKGSKRLWREARCAKCFLRWCSNRRKRGHKLPSEIEIEERRLVLAFRSDQPGFQ